VRNEFLIRETTSKDLNRLREIIDLSFPRFFRYFALHSILNETEPTLVSEKEGVIAGFAKVIDFHVGDGKYGCILWIAVHPQCRRRGVALSLIYAGVDYLKAQGAQAVFASTQRKNKATEATLGKAGFERIDLWGLWRLFGWRLLSFFGDIWLAPSEVVLIHT
jgi:[ribosomal protein S18]-alanine N-acetyltransferase